MSENKYKFKSGELDSDIAVETELGLRNIANELARLNDNIEEMNKINKQSRWPMSAVSGGH